MRLALIALVACSSPKAMPTTTDNTAPEWFRGAWKLEWAKAAGEQPTLTRTVRDIQTPTVFASVRIDFDRPVITATSFDALTDAELVALSKQRGGFAGSATFDSGVADWKHDFDFQNSQSPDTARIKPLGPTTVLEEGLDGDFQELWWKLSSGDGKYLGIKVTVNGRVEKVLSVVGDHFAYGRNRAKDLPAKNLTDLMAAKPSRDEIIQMIDCEFSYGLVRGGRMPWEIRFSSIPWREGKALDVARELAGGVELVNTFTPDDMKRMLSSDR